jgi:hypothetical protein
MTALKIGEHDQRRWAGSIALGYDWAAWRTSQTRLAREPNGILTHGHNREEKTFFKYSNIFIMSLPI